MALYVSPQVAADYKSARPTISWSEWDLIVTAPVSLLSEKSAPHEEHWRRLKREATPRSMRR